MTTSSFKMADKSVRHSSSKEQQQVCIDQYNLIDTFKDLYDKKEMTDCQFVFHNEINYNKKQVKLKNELRISAHKLILANRSPVFKAMFYGLLSDNKEIEITDISFDVFNQMLR